MPLQRSASGSILRGSGGSPVGSCCCSPCSFPSAYTVTISGFEGNGDEPCTNDNGTFTLYLCSNPVRPDPIGPVFAQDCSPYGVAIVWVGDGTGPTGTGGFWYLYTSWCSPIDPGWEWNSSWAAAFISQHFDHFADACDLPSCTWSWSGVYPCRCGAGSNPIVTIT